MKKEDLPRENNIMISNVGTNNISEIWEEFSKLGWILSLKVDFIKNNEKIQN